MAAPKSLSEQDLAAARTELSGGKPFTVWFTSAAVGVPAGGSAKVISIDDMAEGDFIQVRPAGKRDTMFCSPSELTRIRPARKPAPQPAARAPERTAPESEPPSPPSRPQQQPEPESIPAVAQRQSPPVVPDRQSTPAPAAERAPDRPRPAGGRTAARPVEVTVTLSATAEGEWTVEVMVGKKRTVRPTSVQPADVARAARSLPPVVAEAIEASLEAARQRQLDRVERLRTELEAAQRALQELSS
ncbi:DUF6319 family protein [Pseudonocardia xinjiangensis]|uniref:DUF6319 family protein n=1 Tax=Pseudonocardia xinjiangensis TaxID=75289 RepID=UPI003D9250D8